MSIEQFIVTLLRWLGFDKEPDEGRRRFMLGMVFTAATVQFGLGKPAKQELRGLAAWQPEPGDAFFGIDRTVATPRTATISSISDILKQLYPQEAVKRALHAESPMLNLWSRTT